MSDITAESTPEPVVTHNDELHRFEVHLGHELAGFIDYTHTDDVLDLTHTEVDPAFGGKGIGGTLVKGALDLIRGEGGLTIVPTCPFVATFIKRNPEYADLVA